MYGEKDADGFYWGECRGRRGYVPHNMVEELKDPPGQPSRRALTQSERWGDIYASMPVKKMIALYDYDPHELSPNVDAVRFLYHFLYYFYNIPNIHKFKNFIY